MISQNTFQLAEQKQGVYDITELIAKMIKESSIQTGTCQLYVHSSHASLLINDIADESTKKSTADFLAQLAPDNADMKEKIKKSMSAIPKKLRPALSQNSLNIPVTKGRPGIGIWQGIYLWDQITQQNERKITITIMGE